MQCLIIFYGTALNQIVNHYTLILHDNITEQCLGNIAIHAQTKVTKVKFLAILFSHVIMYTFDLII